MKSLHQLTTGQLATGQLKHSVSTQSIDQLVNSKRITEEEVDSLAKYMATVFENDQYSSWYKYVAWHIDKPTIMRALNNARENPKVRNPAMLFSFLMKKELAKRGF